ncbi:MAG: alpha/beta hydrolase [Candidatus Baltobacteraceae bacterium]
MKFLRSLQSLLLVVIVAAATSVSSANASVNGHLSVAEDRTKPGGRAIDISYVVVPATAQTGKDPIFLIAGGPGQSSIKTSVGSISALVPAGDRDVVMVDQRGTGASHPLECNLFPTEADMFRAIYPLDIITACRSKLAATSDLDAYGTDAAADDLNDVRVHLGYKKIVLAGSSYGTTVALDYLRRHGDSVAAAVLNGVAPPGPLNMSAGAQAALDDLERRCRVDAACAAAYPQFGAELQTLLLRAKQSGIEVKGGAIASDVLVERLRDALYSAAVAAYLPLIVHRAVNGEPGPLAQLVSVLSHQIPGSLATGMFLSVTCSEDMPFITASDVAAESAKTFLGDARYREQQAACRAWNVRPVDRSFLDPIRSNVPVLMISGADDPATPARYGAEAVRYLPNGRQVVVPEAGHFIDSPCVDAIKRQFLNTYDVRSLDITCLKAVQHPPFVTK